MKFVSQENESADQEMKFVSREIDFAGQEMSLTVRKSLFLLRN